MSLTAVAAAGRVGTGDNCWQYCITNATTGDEPSCLMAVLPTLPWVAPGVLRTVGGWSRGLTPLAMASDHAACLQLAVRRLWLCALEGIWHIGHPHGPRGAEATRYGAAGAGGRSSSRISGNILVIGALVRFCNSFLLFLEEFLYITRQRQSDDSDF